MKRVASSIAVALFAVVGGCSPRVVAPTTTHDAPLAVTSASATNATPPSFTLRVVDQTTPSMHVEYPRVHFPSDAASLAIDAVIEREANDQQRAFVVDARAAMQKDPAISLLEMQWRCGMTILKPRIASVACDGVEEIGPNGAFLFNAAHTWSVDGDVVHELKPAAFFVTDAPVGDGWRVRAGAAIGALMQDCGGPGAPLSTNEVDAAIDGFSVDADAMRLLTTNYGCSAAGFEATMRWKDLDGILDENGAITRVRE